MYSRINMTKLTKKINFFRKFESLDIKVLCNEKKLKLKGSFGICYYPLNSQIKYIKSEKKLILDNYMDFSNTIGKSFFIIHHLLMMQSCVGVIKGFKKKLNIVV